MKHLIEQFEKDLKMYIENTFNSSNEKDEVKKFDETEEKVSDYVDYYLLKSSLMPKDVALPTQHILDEFARSKGLIE